MEENFPLPNRPWTLFSLQQILRGKTIESALQESDQRWKEVTVMDAQKEGNLSPKMQAEGKAILLAASMVSQNGWGEIHIASDPLVAVNATNSQKNTCNVPLRYPLANALVKENFVGF